MIQLYVCVVESMQSYHHLQKKTLSLTLAAKNKMKCFGHKSEEDDVNEEIMQTVVSVKRRRRW
mgnify:CR=1 FL=1